MTNKEPGQLRREYQMQFQDSGKEIEIGNPSELPLPLDRLAATDENSDHVIQSFNGGLTARVYKIAAMGKFWTLKLKRAESKVRNIDGQTSFLNEVQRRADFTRAKANPQKRANFDGIVDTQYASFKHGILLSPWIEGMPATQYTESLIDGLFETLFYCEAEGLFEYDLSPGNLIDNGKRIVLFDFGYMYGFNPRKDFNADGQSQPIFHMAERFETRAYFQYLMDIETAQGVDYALKEFEIEKRLALKWYENKLRWLDTNRADAAVKNWIGEFIKRWNKGLVSQEALAELYRLESFRSYVLDLHDDLSGKSCTAATLKKADKILHVLRADFTLLKENTALFWDDAGLDRSTLIEKYTHKQALAKQWQLA